MRIRRLRRGTILAIAVSALGLGVAPAVAVLCHPDPPGTHTLVVKGSVLGYAMRAGRVTLTFTDRSACSRRFTWRPSRSTSRRLVGAGGASSCAGLLGEYASPVAVPNAPPDAASATDGGRTAVVRGNVVEISGASGAKQRFLRVDARPAQKVVLSGRRLVVLVRGTAVPDRPDRIEAYDAVSGRFLGNRALFTRAVTLDLAGDIALYGDANRGGLYALRLSDGLTTVVGPTQRHDMPQIESPGVVYQDDMLKDLDGRGRVAIKFIPTRALHRFFRNTGDTLATRGSITSFALDGRRVAFAVREPGASCDEIKVWDIPWRRDIANASEDDDGLTCPERHGPGGIVAVALGGLTAEWATNYAGYTRVGATNTRNCVERRVGGVREPEHDTVRAVAGDRALLVVAASRHRRGHLEFVDPYRLRYRAVWTDHAPRLAAADSGHVAILRRFGPQVDVYDSTGTLLRTLAVHAPRAIALRGDQLAVLTRSRRLDLYDVTTGLRREHWQLPAGTDAAIDLHYGIALFTAGRRVFALRVGDGHETVLARAPGRVGAQIDDAGVAYRYNTATTGVVRFISMTAVEAKLAGRKSGF
jgi:hypothetical protein